MSPCVPAPDVPGMMSSVRHHDARWLEPVRQVFAVLALGAAVMRRASEVRDEIPSGGLSLPR